MWVLLVAPDEDLGRYQARFAALLAEHAARPDVQALWRGWLADAALVHGYTVRPDGRSLYLDEPNEASCAWAPPTRSPTRTSAWSGTARTWPATVATPS